MAPKFGTSGLRGLVTELTDDCVSLYVTGFVSACATGTGLYVGHDLRASSPQLARAVAQAAAAAGVKVWSCGPIPTPALALAAMAAGAGAIMVTGSHIPADRNGLKFYTPQGEITKDDEAAITQSLGQPRGDAPVAPVLDAPDAAQAYLARYASAFRDTLQGQRIGVYAHSAVGRDALAALLQELGATVVPLGRSDIFVPVDTEAVSDGLRQQLRLWAQENAMAAIVSTDADGDRPLLTDQHGEVVPGDILGQITAAALGAETVVTPVSSNSGVVMSGSFETVVRTRIGSPYVIAGMQAAKGRVVGYEANGGFLLGFAADGPTGSVPALMTRDALLPLLCVLGKAAKTDVASIVAAQPARFTVADRLQDIDLAQSAEFISALRQDTGARAAFIGQLGSTCVAVDDTDGLRMTLNDQRVVHVRPSGNAPELRLYVEAGSLAAARETLATGLGALRRSLFQPQTSQSL